jgi:hypothetical protein
MHALTSYTRPDAADEDIQGGLYASAQNVRASSR